jgi:hypothetical protein
MNSHLGEARLTVCKIIGNTYQLRNYLECLPDLTASPTKKASQTTPSVFSAGFSDCLGPDQKFSMSRHTPRGFRVFRILLSIPGRNPSHSLRNRISKKFATCPPHLRPEAWETAEDFVSSVLPLTPFAGSIRGDLSCGREFIN